ncbi:unnamed protein product [Gadus morhua 'NCC']
MPCHHQDLMKMWVLVQLASPPPGRRRGGLEVRGQRGVQLLGPPVGLGPPAPPPPAAGGPGAIKRLQTSDQRPPSVACCFQDRSSPGPLPVPNHEGYRENIVNPDGADRRRANGVFFRQHQTADTPQLWGHLDSSPSSPSASAAARDDRARGSANGRCSLQSA